MFYSTIVLAVYYLFLVFIGLASHKQKYPLIEDKQRFCIFVPCHNEADVIAATVENFANLSYTKELFDIFFIADNCKDETANEIRKVINRLGLSNFHVFERFVNNPEQKGKPHAINWGINKIQQEGSFYEKYDMFMVLDADNFADANIMQHINSQYFSYKENSRPELIQTYLDSKNRNNLIARGYYCCYRISNGFWQLSKHKVGLNPAIGGTGFAITTSFLNEIGGYNCSSLTEDLEIQTIATLKGRRIAYNGNVRIYDEKPTGLKQSIIQKTRWAQGHWYIAFKYIWRLLISLFNFKQIKSFFRKIDNIVYLLAMYNLVSILIMLSLRLYFMVAGVPVEMLGIVQNLIFGAAIFSYFMLPIASLYDGTKEEKKTIVKDFVPNLISSLIASFTFTYAAVVGLFKFRNQKVWKKTVHKVTTMVSQPIIAEGKEACAFDVECIAQNKVKELEEILVASESVLENEVAEIV